MSRLVLLFALILGLGMTNSGAAFPQTSVPQDTQRLDTFHVALFVCDDDSLLGPAAVIDYHRLVSLAQFLAEQLQERYAFKLTTYTGPACTAQQMRKFIQTDQGSPNDILMFVYACHGANDESDGSRLPILTFSTSHPGTVPVEEVVSNLSRAGYKHVFVAIDACNRPDPSAHRATERHCFTPVHPDTSRLPSLPPGISPAEALLTSFDGFLFLGADMAYEAHVDKHEGSCFSAYLDRLFRTCVEQNVLLSMETAAKLVAGLTGEAVKERRHVQVPAMFRFQLEPGVPRGCPLDSHAPGALPRSLSGQCDKSCGKRAH